MKVKVMCRKFECRKDIHYKTLLLTRCIDKPPIHGAHVCISRGDNSFFSDTPLVEQQDGHSSLVSEGAPLHQPTLF